MATAALPRSGSGGHPKVTPTSPFRRRVWAVIRPYVLFLLLPNVPAIALARVVGVERGLVNIDYAIGAAIALVVPRWVGAAVLSAIMAIDLFETVEPIWFFQATWLGPREFGRLLVLNPWIAVASLAVAAGLFAFWRAVLPAALPRVRQCLPRLMAVAGLLAVADAWNGTLFSLTPVGAMYMRSAANPATSGATVFLRHLRARRHVNAYAAAVPADAATWRLRGQILAGGALPPRIALVVVEAWGQLVSQPANEALIARFKTPEILQRFDVTTGTVPFHGASFAGEVRELCGERIAENGVPDSRLAHCLPHMLQQAGYTTVAYHGYHGRFYARKHWYPKLGFQTTVFRDGVESEQPGPRCGRILSGVCDSAMANLVVRRLDRDPAPRVFAHWMTLESHFPIPAAPVGSPAARQCQALVGDAPSAVCDWFATIKRTVSVVASIPERARVDDLMVIVVGDHPPPELSPGVRAFFNQSVVPFVILSPKAKQHVPR